MNIGALIVLFKLLKDAGAVSPLVIGPPAPEPKGPGGVPSYCIRADGKLTFPCWQKFIDPAGSNSDWQDYLKGR